MSTLLKGTIGEAPGKTLTKLFYTVAVQQLPDTLASGLGSYMRLDGGQETVPYGDGGPEQTTAGKCYKLADIVPVVHDKKTCAQFAPARLTNHKKVAGLGLGTVGAAIPRGTTWTYIEHTFFPSPQVECFPSLEWPFLTRVRPLKDEHVQAAETVAGDVEETDGPISFTVRAADQIAIDLLAPYNGDLDASLLGRAFGGAAPVLIYRMRPTLFAPINGGTAEEHRSSTFRGTTEEGYRVYDVTSGKGSGYASERTGLNQSEVQSHPNIRSSTLYDFNADEVHDVSWNFSENERCNMVFARTPYRAQSQFETHGLLGNPVVDNPDVAKHGLRLRTVDWPFYPPDGVAEDESSIGDLLTSLNEELWMELASVDSGTFFARGNVRTVFKPWIKAGHYVSVAWQGWKPIDNDNTYPGFTGYISMVTHSVRVGGSGEVTASTSIELDRIAPAGGAKDAAYNFPPRPELNTNKLVVVVDPETGEELRGTVETDENGRLTFTPAGGT